LRPTHPRRKSKKQPSAKRNPHRRSPEKRRPAGKLFEDLLALQARLRAPNGCPWDREQTHSTLRTFLLEETHEVLDAMDSGDPKKFASELGDLLLQIIFHALIASESNQFEIRDVIRSIHEKMVRRHPHVFGKVKADTSAQVLKNWEQLKSEERRKENGAGKPSAPKKDSILSSVPKSLPALMEAHQITRRAANIGFDWNKIEELLEKLDEEISEVRSELKVAPASLPASGEENRARSAPTAGSASSKRLEKQSADSITSANSAIAEEIGDLLFTAANLARFAGLDPELTLKKANQKFTTRFQWMEQEAQSRGTPLAQTPREKMEDLWNQSKAQRKPQQA
jgi:tetrapyrrole methylase family protein/MazG family protein